MFPEDRFQFVPQFLRRNFVSVLLAVFGVIFLAIGFFVSSFSPQDKKDELVFEAGNESLQNDDEKKTVLGSSDRQGSLRVDIAGAVMKPGVYTLADDARMQDAVMAAGGFLETANKEWVAKKFNLASRLQDGLKVYIPFSGEEGLSEGTGGYIDNTATPGRVNINTATQAQLEGLSGVGPVTAQKIIASRPYGAVDDLVTKKVIGQSTFEKIKSEVVAQ
jgi:competence protein ComEA